MLQDEAVSSYNVLTESNTYQVQELTKKHEEELQQHKNEKVSFLADRQEITVTQCLLYRDYQYYRLKLMLYKNAEKGN